MEIFQQVIIDSNFDRIGSFDFADFICHAYCHKGNCCFEYNGRQHNLNAGDCMIIPSRIDLMTDIDESSDFVVDVIYVEQGFIQMATPQSNYGMRGHLALFDNPIMQLTKRQQAQCANNFATIKSRLAAPKHHFYKEIMMNAIQTMILDFFDFHAELYGFDKISTQYQQIMSQFIDMLERGDYRENRDIGYYADALCITPKYLSEVSKKVSGLPANYWITRYTALDISRLLRDRSRSIVEISDLFGFSSLSHFSRYVQNNLGAKPTDLRE